MKLLSFKMKRQILIILYAILLVFVCRVCIRFLEGINSKQNTLASPRENSYEKKTKQIKIAASESQKRSQQAVDRAKRGKHPIVLIWTTSRRFEERGIEFIAEEKYGSCNITMDRSTLQNSIAVVMFNNNLRLVDLDLPDHKTRTPDQSYVFWTAETPAKTYRFRDLLETPQIDPMFNLSMSLMTTADVQITFGSFRRALEKSNQLKLSTKKSSRLWKKTKFVVWAVSNCYGLPGATERILYAKSLVKAGLKLDKFGKCFGNTSRSLKFSDYFQDYKFYLAFENSLHCPSYVTEKFWRNAIDTGTVPIVWGPTKEDVEKVAPPKSFIHVEDFEKPIHLVRYLNYLNKNYTAYMEYHKWRDTPISSVKPDNMASGHFELLSNLCHLLVKENHPRKTISSISKLIYETGYPDEKCLRPFSNLTKAEQKEVLNF